MSIFGTKEEILAQLEAFRRFNEWEEKNPIAFAPEEALDAVGSLYNFMSAEARERNDDPTYAGARSMMAALARLPCTSWRSSSKGRRSRSAIAPSSASIPPLP